MPREHLVCCPGTSPPATESWNDPYYSVSSYERSPGPVRTNRMYRTYTSELAPEVLDRLDAYAARFRDDFNRPRQAQYSGVYLQGLILDGERKSIEPMSRKVALLAGLAVADLDQALQQFLGQSTWDERAVWKRYRSTRAATFASPAGIFIIDDTSFPEQGKHSVGTQWQYCGARARRPTVRSPPRSTTSARRATIPWRCGSTSPRAGRVTPSGSTRPASPRPSGGR